MDIPWRLISLGVHVDEPAILEAEFRQRGFVPEIYNLMEHVNRVLVTALADREFWRLVGSED